MDKIGVSLPPQQPHISPPDKETSVRFITIKRKFRESGICVRQNLLTVESV